MLDNNYENNEKRKVGRPKKITGEQKEKRKVGRPKIYTEEEKRERKKKYDIEYQKKRYNSDEDFKYKCKDRSINRYYSMKNDE